MNFPILYTRLSNGLWFNRIKELHWSLFSPLVPENRFLQLRNAILEIAPRHTLWLLPSTSTKRFLRFLDVLIKITDLKIYIKH